MAGWNPKLWQRGYARAALMGREPTFNPSPAAAFLLRMKVAAPKMHNQSVARRRLAGKRTRTSNPVPAALMLASKLLGGKLRQRLLGSERYDGGPLVTTVNDFLERIKKGDLAAVQQLHREATNVAGKHRMQWAKVWNTELAALGGALSPKVRAEIKRLDPTSTVASGGEKKPAKTGIDESAILAAAAPTIIRETLKQPKQRVQYENFVDPVTGVLKRRRKTPRASSVGRVASSASVSRIPPAAMRAGVIIGGLAAGYWIGSKLNKRLVAQFGNKAVEKQKAGVAAALAFREARAEAEAAKGAPLTQREMASLAAEYKKALVHLGYNPKTFVYERSALEKFFQSQADDEEETDLEDEDEE